VEPIETRPAVPDDAEAMATIYAEGVTDRVATFQARPKTADEMRELVGSAPVLVVAERGGTVIAWAKVGRYDDPQDYYAGVGEATLYVARAERGRGVGPVLLDALAKAVARAGYHKLIGKIFTSNEPSIELVRRCGWAEVGVHRRHGQLDGEWKDVLVVEKLLGG
jgi:L-amino acid N-acyltransferase YncA